MRHKKKHLKNNTRKIKIIIAVAVMITIGIVIFYFLSRKNNITNNFSTEIPKDPDKIALKFYQDYIQKDKENGHKDSPYLSESFIIINGDFIGSPKRPVLFADRIPDCGTEIISSSFVDEKTAVVKINLCFKITETTQDNNIAEVGLVKEGSDWKISYTKLIKIANLW